MSAMDTMQTHFDALSNALCGDAIAAAGDRRITLEYRGEDSTFLRFSQAKVRQASRVRTSETTLAVVRGRRRASGDVALSGDAAADIASLRAERESLSALLDLLPDDPHLLMPDAPASSRHAADAPAPDAGAVIDAVTRHAAGTDFVGFFAGGPMVRGYADSNGQRNWHGTTSAHFDWSLVHRADRAVKSTIASPAWDEAGFAAAMERARGELALIAQPPRTLAPGAYRAYFSPGAVADLVGLLNWGGVGLRAFKTGSSPLQRLYAGEAVLSDAFTLSEATARGTAPRFQATGFVKPDAVPLVTRGRPAGQLVAPRSKMEYDLPSNGANEYESGEALRLEGGDLPEAEVLTALDTGVYLNNLHYLNYSDRLAGRVTGMTRFACFWVEGGRIAAPIGVMRFDDSLLRMFGEGLLALTDTPRVQADDSTYGLRQLGSVTAPGALVEEFRLVL